MHAFLLQKLRGTYCAHFQIHYISVFFYSARVALHDSRFKIILIYFLKSV